MALMIGKQATSAYERNKNKDKKSKEPAPSDTSVETESSAGIEELATKIDDAIERRNWKLLESFWSELRPKLSSLEEEEGAEGEGESSKEGALAESSALEQEGSTMGY